MLIFNNDATPFTLASFKTWLDDLNTRVGVVRIMVSGGALIKATSKVLTLSFLYEDEINYYGLLGVNTSTGDVEDIYQADFNTIFSGATLNDGVNKIN